MVIYKNNSIEWMYMPLNDIFMHTYIIYASHTDNIIQDQLQILLTDR